MTTKSDKDERPGGFWRTRYALGYLVLGAVAAYFLLTEHRAHFLGALPFLLLLACPLMHVFMHHGHGGHGDHGKSGRAGGPGEKSTPKVSEGSGGDA